MRETSQLWIEAAIVLAHDTTARIPCPECAAEFLVVLDAPRPNEIGYVNRYLQCTSCQAFQVLSRVRA